LAPRCQQLRCNKSAVLVVCRSWSRGIRPVMIPPIYSDESRAGGIGAGCPNFRLHLISMRLGGFWFELKGERTRLACCSTRPASSVFPRCSRRGVANHTRGRVCSPFRNFATGIYFCTSGAIAGVCRKLVFLRALASSVFALLRRDEWRFNPVGSRLPIFIRFTVSGRHDSEDAWQEFAGE